ncbi:MAG TPA: nitroreductase family protein [Bacteroidales bacterium]|nr:nitroreductase family protein [Bacteroidales bacterium]
MDFTELIRNRESIRNYDSTRVIPIEVLERILEAGRLAPSACNIQPWKFIVISSPEMLAKVRACYLKTWFRDAPHILIVVGYKDESWQRNDGYNSIETDIAIAMTHLILGAENEGIGTCWIENYNPLILRESLDLKENQVVFGITPLGYQKQGFKKAGNKKRKPFNEVVSIL